MGLSLTAEETAMLAGDRGPAAAFALRLLVRMAELQGASRLLPIVSAHIDGSVYEGDAVVDFVEHLARLGGRVVVPTTLNAVSVEVGSWERLGIPTRFGQQATRIVDAYLAMGVRPTFSCAPYQLGHQPALGDQVAWGESNAIAYCNSVLGARSERYGDFLDIAAALTGRVPAVGLHLTENRRAERRFVVGDDIPLALRTSDVFWPVLGYWLGEQVQHQVAVVEGLPSAPTADQLKSFFAAAASSGAVGLMHLVGITPEAPDVVTACQGRVPDAVTAVRRRDLADTARRLRTARVGDPVGAVVLGSPHLSVPEFETFSALAQGRRKAPSVRVLLTTNRFVLEQVRQNGALDVAAAFGAEVVTDTCILLAPLLSPDTGLLMTNSGKYAHYAPGLLNVDVVFASVADCIRSAETGRVVLDDDPWGQPWA